MPQSLSRTLGFWSPLVGLAKWIMSSPDPSKHWGPLHPDSHGGLLVEWLLAQDAHGPVTVANSDELSIDVVAESQLSVPA
jgi:hypothetical protein